MANTISGMTHNKLTAIGAITLALTGTALLAGCGSQTKTVTVASAPATATTQSTTTATQTTPTTTTPTTPSTTTPTGAGGGTPAPSPTHTAPEPAFTQQEVHAEGVSAAAELVRARGYTPNDTARIPPQPDPARAGGHSHRLQRRLRPAGVLLRRRALHRHRYQGTERHREGASPRATPKWRWPTRCIKPGDPLSSPSGGQRDGALPARTTEN